MKAGAAERPTMIELEQYLSGEATNDLCDRVEHWTARDPTLATWLSERAALRDALERDPRRKPFSRLVELAGSKPRQRSSWRQLWYASVAASAAAAVLLAWIVLPRTVEHDPAVAVRGGLSAKVAVLRDGRSTIFRSGGQLHPGDRLRLSIDDPHGGFVAVLLQEASGRATVVYTPGEIGRLGPGSRILPGSLELDERLGRERLYILLSKTRPKVQLWIEQLQRAFRKRGFYHDWLPAHGTRLSLVEYTKVRRR